MIDSSEYIHTVDIIAQGLGSLLPNIAFVGGATIIFYVDEEEGIDHRLRPTKDIDCVIDVATRLDFNNMEAQLRKLGFQPCIEQGAPLCRYLYRGIQVDVMPKDGAVLGFTNQWYQPGIEQSESKVLPSGREIRIFSVPYFLATKLEAFLDRGNQDFYRSPDLEDFITVLGARKSIRADLYNSADEVKDFLREKVRTFKDQENFIQSIEGHLAVYKDSQDRAREVLDILQSI